MYGVKRESNEEICRGCLSTDRRLSPLANYDLFFTLLEDKQKLEALKSPTLRLCWECNASLQRMSVFQTQARHAHRLLEELVNELPTRGLSQLTTCYKQDYDVVIEDGVDGIEEQFVIPIKEETKGQIDVLNHTIYPCDDHFFDETDNLETHVELDLVEETRENDLIEAIPQNKYKRKLKRVKTTSVQTKNKRKKIETVVIKKSNRTGLRSSGEIIPPLYPNKDNGNKKDSIKSKIKVSNTREFKQLKRKRCLNRRDPTNTVKVEKENQTLYGKDKAIKDLQNMVTNDKAEAYTELDIENLDVKNTKEQIDDDDIDQNNHLNDSESENDNCDKNDPDFEEESSNDSKNKVGKDKGTKNLQNMVTNDKAEDNTELEVENLDVKNTKEKIDDDDIEQNNHLNESEGENDNFDKNDPDFEEECSNDSNNKVKIKKTGVANRDRWLRCVCIRFDVINELDEYFTKVDLTPEELKSILDSELSYKTEGQPYSCNYCGYCFQQTKTLKMHKRTRHKQIAKCKNRVYLMYRCNICNKIIRKDHAEAHMKYLHRWKYYCKECDKDFWDKAEGRSHYNEFHKEVKWHNCSLCRYVCASRKVLEKHVRDRHTPMACEECGKLTAGADYLQLHQRRHRRDGSAPEQRYCVPCDKHFLSVYTYQLHLKASTVHRGRTKRVFCTECGKEMSNKTSLRSHYDYFHSDKTQFQCPHCDKHYSRKSGLRMHIDSVHLKKKLPKDKLCSICGRGFSSVRTLTHHIRTHTGERPHVCPHCSAAFAQPYPLRKHLATQHGVTPAQNKEAPTTQNKETPTIQA